MKSFHFACVRQIAILDGIKQGNDSPMARSHSFECPLYPEPLSLTRYWKPKKSIDILLDFCHHMRGEMTHNMYYFGKSTRSYLR